MQQISREMNILNDALEIVSKYIDISENRDIVDIFEKTMAAIINANASVVEDRLIRRMNVNAFKTLQKENNPYHHWEIAFKDVLLWDDDQREFRCGNVTFSRTQTDGLKYIILVECNSGKKTLSQCTDFSIEVIDKIGLVRICKDHVVLMSPSQLCVILEKLGKLDEEQTPVVQTSNNDGDFCLETALNSWGSHIGRVLYLDESQFVVAELFISVDRTQELPYNLQIITFDECGTPQKTETIQSKEMYIDYIGQYDAQGYFHYSVCDSEFMLEQESVNALQSLTE